MQFTSSSSSRIKDDQHWTRIVGVDVDFNLCDKAVSVLDKDDKV